MPLQRLPCDDLPTWSTSSVRTWNDCERSLIRTPCLRSSPVRRLISNAPNRVMEAASSGGMPLMARRV